MHDGRSYLTSTAPAIAGLFNLLDQYGGQKILSLVQRSAARTPEAFDQHDAAATGAEVSREVIAGSILQIAYVGIKKFAVLEPKPPETVAFEEGMNALIAELPSPRTSKVVLPTAFCVGRLVGNLPFGVVVYAARNQFNHFDEDRLSVVNEVVFNHLQTLWPQAGYGVSFDLSDRNSYRSYSALWALGWVSTTSDPGYAVYNKDMHQALRVGFEPFHRADLHRLGPLRSAGICSATWAKPVPARSCQTLGFTKPHHGTRSRTDGSRCRVPKAADASKP
jgi:hypothetical protein